MAAGSGEQILARPSGRRALGRTRTHRGDAGDEAATMTRQERPCDGLRRYGANLVTVAVLAIVLAAAPVAAYAAAAQPFPNRPIHLIVPFAAGVAISFPIFCSS